MKADFKGTCKLCWDTIRVGDNILLRSFSEMGVEIRRYVHTDCQEMLENSSPEELARIERASVISR